MKKINYIKFSLDLLMALLFVLFFNIRVLGGLAFHEIAGLVFAVMYFTHIFLNWKWAVNVTRKIFDRKLPWNTRGSYALNLLLLVSMSFVIISGILISKVVFPNIHVTNQMWFHVTHVAVSFLVLLLIGVHVGLHWQWVVNVWKKIWHFKSNHAWGRYAAKIVTVLILMFGVYEISNTGYVNQLSGITSVFEVNSQNMQSNHEGESFHGPGDGMEHGDRGQFDGGMKPGSDQMNTNSTASTTGQNGQTAQENSNISQNSISPMKQHREGGGSANFLQVISTYTGIMSVVCNHYLLPKKTNRKKEEKNK